MSPPIKLQVTLSILAKNLKPGVTVLFAGGHKETVTEVVHSECFKQYLVRTDLHPDGIVASESIYITIER